MQAVRTIDFGFGILDFRFGILEWAMAQKLAQKPVSLRIRVSGYLTYMRHPIYEKHYISLTSKIVLDVQKG